MDQQDHFRRVEWRTGWSSKAGGKVAKRAGGGAAGSIHRWLGGWAAGWLWVAGWVDMSMPMGLASTITWLPQPAPPVEQTYGLCPMPTHLCAADDALEEVSGVGDALHAGGAVVGGALLLQLHLGRSKLGAQEGVKDCLVGRLAGVHGLPAGGAGQGPHVAGGGVVLAELVQEGALDAAQPACIRKAGAGCQKQDQGKGTHGCG